MGKPNLIYIFADQLRQSSVGFNGDNKARTSYLDELCKESLNLCNAVSGHPVCAPYRASLFTGKYTTSTEMVINEIRLNPNHKCFAHVLNENGYDTSYIGKWHMYANELGNHYDPSNSFVPPGIDRLGFDGYFAAYNFHHNYYGAAAYYHLDTPEKQYCHGYEPDVQTDMAIEQLDKLNNTNRPFALFLSLGTPHDPWSYENVPGKYLELFNEIDFTLPENYLPENDKYADAWACLSEKDRKELTEWIRVYYAMTANLDYNIGRLMTHIKNLGLDENSIIVFTSDHGELFGAHGRRAKNIFYDEAVRVPFLIKWENRIKKNEKSDICFNTVDIMPTLLSMMDLPIPSTVEGVDISGCILKDEGIEPLGSLMMGTGATAIFGDGYEWRGWRTKKYTYAIYRVDGSEYLFDNQNDPFQMNNLIDCSEFTKIKNILKEQMKNEMEKIGDLFLPCSFYEENRIKNRLILDK